MCRLRPGPASLRLALRLAGILALGLGPAGCATTTAERMSSLADGQGSALFGQPQARRSVLTTAEAEALIARAIIAHEMRHP
jgi:hypothetical protein